MRLQSFIVVICTKSRILPIHLINRWQKNALKVKKRLLFKNFKKRLIGDSRGVFFFTMAKFETFVAGWISMIRQSTIKKSIKEL